MAQEPSQPSIRHVYDLGETVPPVIGIVKDGITVALGPTLARDSGVATTLATTLSHVARPIAEKKIKPEIAGREAQLTIQEPKVTEVKGRVASVMPVQVPVFVALPELAGRRPLVVVTLWKAGSL